MKTSSNGSSQQEISWLLREKYNNIQTEEFFKDIGRLAEGEHVDYVIGFVEFLGCKIDLSQKPLIPRTETEYWVEKAIEDIGGRLRKRNSSPPLHVLDMFAGSGCIGIAVQKHVPSAIVDFAEKEERFCEQIKINGGKNIIQADIFNVLRKRNSEIEPPTPRKARGRALTPQFQTSFPAPLPLSSEPRPNPTISQTPSLPPLGQYDYILANPPYVSEEAEVQQSVLDNEPHDAVFAGKDGLDYIRRFLQEAKNYLKKHGVIYMEFDPAQKVAIAHIVKEESYKSHEFFRDQYEKWRYIKIGS